MLWNPRGLHSTRFKICRAALLRISDGFAGLCTKSDSGRKLSSSRNNNMKASLFPGKLAQGSQQRFCSCILCLNAKVPQTIQLKGFGEARLCEHRAWSIQVQDEGSTIVDSEHEYLLMGISNPKP